MLYKGLLLGCVFSCISVFVWLGEEGEVFLKEKGNKIKENRISLLTERAKAFSPRQKQLRATWHFYL